MPYLTISLIAAKNGIEVSSAGVDLSYKDFEDASTVVLEKIGLPAPEWISKGISLVGQWLGIGKGKAKKVQQNELLASMLTQYFTSTGKQATMIGGVCKIRQPVNRKGVLAVAEALINSLRKQYKAGSDDYYDLGLGLNSLHVDSISGVIDRVVVCEFTESAMTGGGTPAPDVDAGSADGTPPPTSPAPQKLPVIPLALLGYLISR